MKKLEYIDHKFKDQPTTKRSVSTVIFHDVEGNFLLQDRKSVSKSGEEWGLFGGGIEEDESPEEALNRELTEEIADLPSNLKYKVFCVGHVVYFSEKQKNYRELFENVFTCRLPKGLKINVLEGDGARWFGYDSLIKLKWIPGDREVIELFYNETLW